MWKEKKRGWGTTDLHRAETHTHSRNEGVSASTKKSRPHKDFLSLNMDLFLQLDHKICVNKTDKHNNVVCKDKMRR